MPTYEDVARVALALPGVEEGTRRHGRSWTVGGKAFAWERPFTGADRKRFGDAEPPPGQILAVACEDLGDKSAVLAQGRRGFFDIAHFDGYPAYLVALDQVGEDALVTALQDGWAAVAPAGLRPGPEPHHTAGGRSTS